MLSLIIFIIALALVFDFLNGFHDAANSIATVVSTRVLSPSQAVLWAAVFNFVAAFVFGTGVAKMISTDLVDNNAINGDVFVILGGLVGAIAWNVITWLLALPTSSSHALFGGYAGAAVAKSGFHVLILKGWVKVILFIFLSPIIGFILGSALMIAAAWIFRRSSPHRVDRIFRRMQLVSAGVYSLAHGGNDAQKTMGIIVALLVAAGHRDWSIGRLHSASGQPEFALWIILACHGAIALGTVFGGWRIVKTMGTGITRLQPVGGFCAESAAAATIICATVTGVPVSTTHAITGSIIGVGTTKGIRSVRWIWGQRIVMAWMLTLPCAAFMSAIAYGIVKLIARAL